MLTNLTRLIKERLNTEIADAAIWSKRQGQEGAKPSIVFDLKLGPRSTGTAPVAQALIIVESYAMTSDDVEALAAEVEEALQDWSARGYGVGLLGVDQTNAEQDYDDVKGVWYAVLSFSAMAITGG